MLHDGYFTKKAVRPEPWCREIRTLTGTEPDNFASKADGIFDLMIIQNTNWGLRMAAEPPDPGVKCPRRAFCHRCGVVQRSKTRVVSNFSKSRPIK